MDFVDTKQYLCRCPQWRRQGIAERAPRQPGTQAYTKWRGVWICLWERVSKSRVQTSGVSQDGTGRSPVPQYTGPVRSLGIRPQEREPAGAKLGHREQGGIDRRPALLSCLGRFLKCFLLDSQAQSLAGWRLGNLPHLANADLELPACPHLTGADSDELCRGAARSSQARSRAKCCLLCGSFPSPSIF